MERLFQFLNADNESKVKVKKKVQVKRKRFSDRWCKGASVPARFTKCWSHSNAHFRIVSHYIVLRYNRQSPDKCHSVLMRQELVFILILNTFFAAFHKEQHISKFSTDSMSNFEWVHLALAPPSFCKSLKISALMLPTWNKWCSSKFCISGWKSVHGNQVCGAEGGSVGGSAEIARFLSWPHWRCWGLEASRKSCPDSLKCELRSQDSN